MSNRERVKLNRLRILKLDRTGVIPSENCKGKYKKERETSWIRVRGFGPRMSSQDSE